MYKCDDMAQTNTCEYWYSSAISPPGWWPAGIVSIVSIVSIVNIATNLHHSASKANCTYDARGA